MIDAILKGASFFVADITFICKIIQDRIKFKTYIKPDRPFT